MAIQAISTIKPQRKKNHFASAALLGAAAGAGIRYIAPTKNELGQILNKDAFQKAISNASTTARAQSRSILKYAGAGALVGTGLNIASKVFKGIKNYQNSISFDYSKYGVFFDSSECACEVMWLG